MGKVWSVEGTVQGIIAKKPLLNKVKGFPYRSFFYIPKIKKYYQDEQLTEDEQKAYNHRCKGLQKLKEIIEKELL